MAARNVMRKQLIRILLVALLIAALPGYASSLRIAVISDLNESYGSTLYRSHATKALQRIIELQPNLVLSTGDMVAGQRLHPPLARPKIEAMWESFHHSVSDPLAKANIPLAVTPGNHDASAYKSFTHEREIYKEQWLARKPEVEFIDESHYPFYYAFSFREIMFVSLDATKVGHLADEQKTWLRQLLADHGAEYKRRVVFGHVPLWPFTIGRERDFLGDHELESLLQRANVDIFLNGHHHAYYPGYKDGIRYISQACLGAGPRSLLGADTRSKRSITVIEFEEDGTYSIEAYHAPGFTSPVDIRKLPANIKTKWAEIIRHDLAVD